MKKMLIVAFVLIFSIPSHSQNITKTNIALYSNFALVNNELTINVDKGISLIKMFELPKAIDRGSLFFQPINKADNVEINSLLYSLEDRNSRWNNVTLSISSPSPKKVPLKMSYMTPTMRWNTVYIGEYSEKDKTLKLSTKALIENNSALSINKAAITLVAGSPYKFRPQVRQNDYRLQKSMAAESYAAPEAPQRITKSEMSEYHVFNYNKAVSLTPNQNLEVSLYPQKTLDVKKVYRYNGSRMGTKVSINLEFINDKASGLGLPMPEGMMKIYEYDDKGTFLFLGESWMNFLPLKKDASLKIGNSFDLVGERKQMSRDRINSKTREETYLIEISNGSNEKKTVLVEEKINGDWKMVKHSLEYKKIKANKIEFELSLEPMSKAKIAYTVQYISK